MSDSLIKTKKVFIEHLDKMKPLRFLEFIEKLKLDFNGVLSKDKLSITEKIDGSALRIGQDRNGRSFIESSTSDPMFNVGDFLLRDLSKGYNGEIGRKFDLILTEFKMDVQFQDVLKRYNQNGIKVIGEVLFIPLGRLTLDKITFIRIPYDRSKLGSLLTFIPFEAVDGDGNPHLKQEDILRDLYKISNDTRKILNPSVQIDSDIDLSAEVDYFNQTIINRYSDLKFLLSSRKVIDKIQKALVISEIEAFQKQLAAKLLSYIDSGLLGSDYEGIVINMHDGTALKVVTDTFKSTEFRIK